MIDAAALALAAEAQVDRGETQVLQEGRVVGAGAQGVDGQVPARISGNPAERRRARVGRLLDALHGQRGPQAITHGDAGLGIGDVG